MSSPETKREGPSFEDVLEELGTPGKFQIIQVSFCYLSMLMTASIVLSFVFLGHEPPHVCKAVNETDLIIRYRLENDSTAQITYRSCDVQISTKDSGKMKEVDTIDCPNGRDFFDAKHTTFLSEWDLVCDSKGIAEFSQTLFSIGQMVGGFMASPVSDRLGRKPVFIGCSFLACLTELCVVAAPNIFVIYGLKFVSGVFYQGVACCFFVYGMEFVSPRHREANGVIMCAVFVMFALMVGAVAFFLQNCSWEYFQGAVGMSGLVFLLYPFFLYESPRWLAANDKVKEALRILEKASKMNGKDFHRVKETFTAYVANAFPTSECDASLIPRERENPCEVRIPGTEAKEKRPNMLTLVLRKSLRRTTLICWFIFTTNVLTYFGLYITSSKVAGDRFLNFTLMTLVELPCLFLVLVMLKKMSRRLVMEIFLALTALCLMTSALVTSFAGDSDGAATASTVLFIFGKFFISGSFNVIYIVLPELFPTNLRSTASGFCNGFARIGSMVAPFLRPLFNVVKWGPALIFTIMCMLAAISAMFLPETKDENLPDTIKDVKNKQRK